MGTLKEKDKVVTVTERLELLKKVVSVFNTYGINYWLEFGTLLGYHRDDAFIPYDADIDIATHDYHLVKKHIDSLKKIGMIEEVYEWTDDISTIFRVYSDNIHIDIYDFKDIHDYSVLKCNRFEGVSSIFRHLYLQLKKRGIVSNAILKLGVILSQKRVFYYPHVITKKVKFYDLDVRVPVDPEKHLLLMYGKTWRTPRTDDVAGTENIWKRKGKTIYYKLGGEKDK